MDYKTGKAWGCEITSTLKGDSWAYATDTGKYVVVTGLNERGEITSERIAMDEKQEKELACPYCENEDIDVATNFSRNELDLMVCKKCGASEERRIWENRPAKKPSATWASHFTKKQLIRIRDMLLKNRDKGRLKHNPNFLVDALNTVILHKDTIYDALTEQEVSFKKEPDQEDLLLRQNQMAQTLAAQRNLEVKRQNNLALQSAVANLSAKDFVTQNPKPLAVALAESGLLENPPDQALLRQDWDKDYDADANEDIQSKINNMLIQREIRPSTVTEIFYSDHNCWYIKENEKWRKK